ncbi:hypothetical protein [Rufibacter sp. LB8]|uniref:hypothetical protein n=1 Tax=Rufibacter sp. LB8 TaxID=2777781 RepID=UPI00178C25CE|nr:hypothetical protein [Rufibacter sp. LB8]
MTQHSKRKWFLVTLANLLVVALLGLFLRWMVVGSSGGFTYKHVLHAHSHVALLGWLYAAFFVGLVVAYLPKERQDQKTYTWQFWLSQATVAGMLVSFAWQGYAAISITFSTAHILLSYYFVYQFLKDTRQARVAHGKHRLSFLFVKAALFFLVLSSLGPWAMGPIMATGQTGSRLYFNAIYFYLHFQYNGWFTFAALGLLVWLLETYQIMLPAKQLRLVFWLLFWACLPAYVLSVLWVKPAAVYYGIAGAAALVQLMAAGKLLLLLHQNSKQILALFGPWAKALLLFSGLAFCLKVFLQFCSAFPYVAELAYRTRLFIIGYLHLVLIGFLSTLVLAFFWKLGWLNFRSWMSRCGMGLFLAAFLVTEVVMLLQGTFFWQGLGALPQYHSLMFWFSTLLPLGVFLFFLGQFTTTPASGTSRT